ADTLALRGTSNDISGWATRVSVLADNSLQVKDTTNGTSGCNILFRLDANAQSIAGGGSSLIARFSKNNVQRLTIGLGGQINTFDNNGDSFASAGSGVTYGGYVSGTTKGPMFLPAGQT